MLITMFDNDGKAIAVNPDRVLFARNSKLVGHVDLITDTSTLMNGQQVVMQLIVRGRNEDVRRPRPLRRQS